MMNLVVLLIVVSYPTLCLFGIMYLWTRVYETHVEGITTRVWMTYGRDSQCDSKMTNEVVTREFGALPIELRRVKTDGADGTRTRNPRGMNHVL